MRKAFGLFCAAKFLQNLRPSWLRAVLSVTGLSLRVVLDLSGGKAWQKRCTLSSMLPRLPPPCLMGLMGGIFVHFDLSQAFGSLFANAILSFLSIGLLRLRQVHPCSGGFLRFPVCASSCLILCGGVTNVGALNKVEATAQHCVAEL